MRNIGSGAPLERRRRRRRRKYEAIYTNRLGY
jgi:hypothetical protein